MAYTSTVTKQSVTKQRNGEYQISIHVIVVDDSDSSIKIQKDYSVRYSTEWSVGDIKAKLQKLIQADWDNLEDEKSLYDSLAFDTMVSQIQVAVNAYTN